MGFWVLGLRLGVGEWVLVCGDLGFGVRGLGLEVGDFGSGVWGLGFGVWGLVFCVGFGVESSGSRVPRMQQQPSPVAAQAYFMSFSPEFPGEISVGIQRHGYNIYHNRLHRQFPAVPGGC